MTDREAMQAIMQLLGPEPVCQCLGCAYETGRSLEILRSQGIEYRGRSAVTKRPHQPAVEAEGNATTPLTDGVVDAFLATMPEPPDPARLARIREKFETLRREIEGDHD